jgi:hypothetical protein
MGILSILLAAIFTYYELQRIHPVAKNCENLLMMKHMYNNLTYEQELFIDENC